MEAYSDELIGRMVAYALRKWNLRISRDEAAEYLRSLGNLYFTVSKIRARKHKKKEPDQTHAS